MKNYLSSCCGALIIFRDRCSLCGEKCIALPTCEKINELISKNISSMKYSVKDYFFGTISIDIKDQFLFESDVELSIEKSLVHDIDFKNVTFIFGDWEENLITSFTDELKNDIIEQLNYLR